MLIFCIWPSWESCSWLLATGLRDYIVALSRAALKYNKISSLLLDVSDSWASIDLGSGRVSPDTRWPANWSYFDLSNVKKSRLRSLENQNIFFRPTLKKSWRGPCYEYLSPTQIWPWSIVPLSGDFNSSKVSYKCFHWRVINMYSYKTVSCIWQMALSIKTNLTDCFELWNEKYRRCKVWSPTCQIHAKKNGRSWQESMSSWR